jgi:hypothetical protein
MRVLVAWLPQNGKRDGFLRVSLRLAALVQAAAFKKIEEAEGLPDAAQGDMMGTDLMGGFEQAVQAGIQEFQFFQEGGLEGLVLLAELLVTLAGEMLGVAAEGGGAEAELPGQGAVGDPVLQAAFNLRAGGVRTDGTAHRLTAGGARGLHHKFAPSRKFPPDAGWISGYQGRGGWASTGGTFGREGEGEGGTKNGGEGPSCGLRGNERNTPSP